MNFERYINQSFGIDKGIYDFDTINEFDEATKFHGWKKINLEQNINKSFWIYKGIYDFDTTNKFEGLQVFTGESESILSTITRNLRQDGSEERKIIDGQIDIKMLF